MSGLFSRCPLPSKDPRFLHYHDSEWGLPVIDDQRIYEKVCLEGFQAGLSWSTILFRREHLRAAFDDFDPEAIASYKEADVTRLLGAKGMIRNRRKIEAAINNARRVRELRDEAGSLAAFFWQFEPPAEERPQHVTSEWLEQNPISPSSTRLAAALKSRGWQFVGPTGMYALMQALGLVNDHIEACSSRAHVDAARAALKRPTLKRPERC